MFPKGFEWVVILIVALLIFGPKNLPKLGKSLGSTVKNIQDGLKGDDDEATEVKAEAEETVSAEEKEIAELEAKLAAAKAKAAAAADSDDDAE